MPSIIIGYLNLMAGAEATDTLMRGFTTIRDLGVPTFGLKRALSVLHRTGNRPLPALLGGLSASTSTERAGNKSPRFICRACDMDEYFMEAHQLRQKTAKKVPKELIGRALTREDAEELLRGLG